MRLFTTKQFARFARKEGLSDKALAKAIATIELGLIDADLGGGLIKQRVAREGSGKRGGFRTLIAYCQKDKAFFLYGFAKKDQANISAADERDLRDYGTLLLALKDKDIEQMKQAGELKEIDYDEED